MFTGVTDRLAIVFYAVTEAKYVGSETENCTAKIDVKRGTIVHEEPGKLATITCHVTFCREKPVLHWYQQANKTVVVPDGKKHKTEWTSGNIFALTFFSIHKEDSGLYYCEGIVGKNKIQGHAIEVIVQDQNNQSESGNATNVPEDHWTAKKYKKLLIYSLAFLGALGLLCCFCLLHFIRRRQVKNKKVPSTSKSELNVFSRYTDAQHCNDVSDKRSVLHQDAVPCLLHFPEGSTVDNNEISCSQTTKTTPNSAYDDCVISTNQLLPATQETLVYATLNHEEHLRRSQPPAETEFIEYAAIGLKK
ncbi:uncharacterized protein LOC128350486 [Hemicordylus capensis]|uniref:uncharacterized protein LOC128350486 n=1 Tax=Hemicordylus capensis TaxID=884348 RepID=UPI0023022D1E|nr:uncharacterized protein LOC128350486 [Hemicordylus capensis]